MPVSGGYCFSGTGHNQVLLNRMAMVLHEPSTIPKSVILDVANTLTDRERVLLAPLSISGLDSRRLEADEE